MRTKILEMWHILTFYYRHHYLEPVGRHHRTRVRMMMMVQLLPDRGIKTLGSQDQGSRAPVRQESYWVVGEGGREEGLYYLSGFY